uniref:Armadillo/beta-catenin-like repeat protein n=1 Tax=Meloidogyne hapla TaxID=6305 RepID=A0A1I8AWZ2_MELHA
MSDASMENIPWSPNFYSADPQQAFGMPQTSAAVPPPRHASFSTLEDFQKRDIVPPVTPKISNNNFEPVNINIQTLSIASTSHQPQPPIPQYSQHSEQQQRLREQRRAMTSQNKVQQWQQFGQMPLQDSGVHSMSHSTHIPSGIRHEEPEKMRQVLPELIPLINDESEEIVLRALIILVSIAKKDNELYRMRAQIDGPLIVERRVVEELLRTLRTHKKNKKISVCAIRALHYIFDNEPTGRDLFVKTLNAHGTGCLEELVHCSGIQEHSCYKYVFLILHNLMIDRIVGKKVIAYLCEMRILTKVLNWLNEKNEKFLNLVIDIISLLLYKNSEQMAFFLALNGYQKLINILANSHHETLLYRAVRLLNRVVQLDPAKIVAAGLLEAAQKHLDIASQRLLRQLLDCIRAISHVPSGDHDIHILLQKLLQLLGTNDMQLKESCTDILANLSANNASNKEFLIDKGAVYGLFQLLHEMEALNEELGYNSQRQNIQERALSLLRSLSSGNVCSGKARQQIITKEIHKQILLERLRNKQRNWPLLKRTLMLLQYIAQEGDLNILKEFRFSIAIPPNFPQFSDAPLLLQSEHFSFVSQTVFLLTEGMNSLPESWELCQRCMDLLRLLAGDEGLMGEIFSELSARWIRLSESQPKLLAPQVILRFFEQLAPGALALLAQLARIPEAALMIGRDRTTLETLRRWTNNSNDVNSSRLAMRVLQLIDSANGKQQNLSGRKVQFTFGEESWKQQRSTGQQQQCIEVNDKKSTLDTEMDFSIGTVHHK